MKLLVPTDAPFTLDPAPVGVQVVAYAPDEAIPTEHLDADAAVVWGFWSDNLRQFASAMPNLRWVQTLAAGPDALLRAGLPERVRVSVGRGFHDRTVTELAVAVTLAHTTDLRRYGRLQEQHEWDAPGWRPLHVEHRVASIIGAEVLIWGFGSIGQNLAGVFAALGARVRGIASTAGERAGFACFTDAELPRLLPETDVLVMVLPSTPATRHVLNAERLALLKPRALVVNVGRGSCIDESALADALREHRIGGASLDVFDPEPLPTESPLWDAPNTIITPHVAGGRPLGVEEALRANLARLQAGQEPDRLVKC